LVKVYPCNSGYFLRYKWREKLFVEESVPETNRILRVKTSLPSHTLLSVLAARFLLTERWPLVCVSVLADGVFSRAHHRLSLVAVVLC
jgi:hypothetical protein